jgi:hypothetical protein
MTTLKINKMISNSILPKNPLRAFCVVEEHKFQAIYSKLRINKLENVINLNK